MKVERFILLFLIPIWVFILWSFDSYAEDNVSDTVIFHYQTNKGVPYYVSYELDHIIVDEYVAISDVQSYSVLYLYNGAVCGGSHNTLVPSEMSAHITMFNSLTNISQNSGAINQSLSGVISMDSTLKLFDTFEHASSYLMDGDTSGWLNKDDFIPSYDDFADAINNAQGNPQISFVDFSADNTIRASWGGLSGVIEGHTDLQTGQYIEEPGSYENAFIKVEFGFSSKDNEGIVSFTSVCDQIFFAHDGLFEISIDDVLSGYENTFYLLYLKVTPYVYNNDDPTSRLYEGNSEYVYYDSKQNVSRHDVVKSGITGSAGYRRGTVFINDFYLSDVVCKRNFEGTYTISWTGSTKDTDLMFIPADDTLVMCFYSLFDKNGDVVTVEPGNSSNRFVSWLYEIGTAPFALDQFNLLGNVRIFDNSITVNVKRLLDIIDNSSYVWDGTVGVAPAYNDGGMLYIGQTTYVNLATGSVVNEVVDNDGSLKYEDVTKEGTSGTGGLSGTDILNYTNVFYSYVSGVVAGVGQLPALFSSLFSFLPSIYLNSIGIIFVLILLLRLLGR